MAAGQDRDAIRFVLEDLTLTCAVSAMLDTNVNTARYYKLYLLTSFNDKVNLHGALHHQPDICHLHGTPLPAG
eukprot:3924763-Heterocapsa_arctica.AAC.1